VRRVTRNACAAVLATIVAAARPPVSAAQRPDTRPFSFVVLGHLRGGHDGRLNPKVTAVVERVRALHPDFAVLTGDIIWSDVDSTPSRPAFIEAQWNAVDSALAGLHIPVYRVPGNHDINDIHTRDIWMRRYGALPRLVTYGNSRLLLLASAFIPPDGDTTHMKYIAGVDLDTAQVAFVRRTLADTGFAHTYVFLGHNLWWEPDAGPWWRQVHPLLAAAHVDNVFSGDYGPMKFSTKERDGVRYYQGAIELQVDVPRLQRFERSRQLSSQVDVFFEVRVRGDSSEVIVHPVAELMGDWTPERFNAINSPPPLTLHERISELLHDRRKLIMLSVLTLTTLAVGTLSGWKLRDRATSKSR
jgi:hypothetical protein